MVEGRPGGVGGSGRDGLLGPTGGRTVLVEFQAPAILWLARELVRLSKLSAVGEREAGPWVEDLLDILLRLLVPFFERGFCSLRCGWMTLVSPMGLTSGTGG